MGFVGYNLYEGNDKFYDTFYKNALPIAHKWVAPEFAHFLGKSKLFNNLDLTISNLIFNFLIDI